MNEIGVVSKVRVPLNTSAQLEDDYYCSVDSTYCKPKSDIKTDNQKIFNSVCSISGGTAICKDAETFESFYSTPPPKCEGGVCDTVKQLEPEEIQNIYDNFITYYGNIQFIKVRDNDTHSIYTCKVESGLLKDNQYLFASVYRDSNNMGTVMLLSDLYWDSFQCRKLDDGYNINSTVLKKDVTDVMKGNIEMTKRVAEYTQYRCETLPVLITLLHKKVGNTGQYNTSGKLYLALGQFDTIITF